MTLKPLMHQSIMLDQANNLSECADDKPEAMSCDLRMSWARDPALVARRPGDGDVEPVQGLGTFAVNSLSKKNTCFIKSHTLGLKITACQDRSTQNMSLCYPYLSAGS